MAARYTLGELANRLDLAFVGDGQRQLTGLASLSMAGPQDLSFCSGPRQLSELGATRAGVVILQREDACHCPADCLLTEDAYLAFARATALFDRDPPAVCGVHPTAVVAADVELNAAVSVGPGAVVASGAVLGANVVVGAGVYLGEGSRLGAGTRVHPNAVLYHDVIVGRDCVIHSQAVLGADGFGFARGPDGWVKIHQLGGVRVGDNVEIGAGTTIDRGTLEHTVIENGVIIDNLVQVGHNCHIGPRTAIAGCAGLAGSTVIGADCTLAGGVGVVGHVEICDNVHVTGMTMVTRSIDRPGSYSSGTRMARTRDWKRSAVRFSQMESILRRLAVLEQARSDQIKGSDQ
ncbi:MAG: UDP-3-O-(3-hydroxymyristoyl)glucosamine N-acyltransferase [Halioglobus sp.]|nr:UDP-3-O-(3-hydroxymyristoyl)glucosamine N-acyltransferase [Halioglobus sp.]